MSNLYSRRGKKKLNPGTVTGIMISIPSYHFRVILMITPPAEPLVGGAGFVSFRYQAATRGHSLSAGKQMFSWRAPAFAWSPELCSMDGNVPVQISGYKRACGVCIQTA